MNYSVKEQKKTGSFEIHNFLPEIGIDNARNEILEGLIADSKYISPKFFYNKKGSALFEEITQLEEYYPTRCEKEILSSLISHINFKFNNLDVIELGSGDASKISLVFSQLSENILETIHYFAIDIDQGAIEKSIEQITDVFPVSCTGIVTDFYQHLKVLPRKNKRLFCFFGSTIGNFNPTESGIFLNQLADLMETGDALLLGADMIKDTAILELAYNDRNNITEAFNKNILHTVNTLLETNFNPDDFEHFAFYNTEAARIEMYLKASKNLEIRSKYTSQTIKIKKGEKIHTENSHKFSESKLKKMGLSAGLSLKNMFFDSQNRFSVSYFLKD